jgi:hypothetical protein
MVLEALVHGLLAPLLWACGEAERHGSRSVWQSKAVHLMAARKQRTRLEGARDKIYPSKLWPQGPTSPNGLFSMNLSRIHPLMRSEPS